MNNMSFGSWLKMQRELRKLTQSEMENLADLPKNYISKYETGALRLPNEENRQKIHAALGTSDEDLVELGVLTKMKFRGETVYLSVREQNPTVILRDGTELDFLVTVETDLVIEKLRPDIESVNWTESMVEIIRQQIRFLGDVQRGNSKSPRASWEEDK